MLDNEVIGNSANGEHGSAQSEAHSFNNHLIEDSNYSQYLFITLKNNDAPINEYLRVLHFVMGLAHSKEVMQYWTEKGKTNRKHMHFIVKQRIPFYPSADAVSKFFREVQRKFKCNRTLKYVTIEPTSEGGTFIPMEWSINLKRYVMHLSRFEDAQHLNFVRGEYSKKETNEQSVWDC